MDSTKVNQKSSKRMSVKLQRLIMFSATMMMTLMTFTACPLDDENGGEDDGGGGGVSGKRLKSTMITCSKPLNQPLVRNEYSYNNDGTLSRVDGYDASSKLLYYSDDNTFNSDGTLATDVLYEAGGSVMMKSTYFYNSNKTLQKIESDCISYTMLQEFTYENGKRIKNVITTSLSIEWGEHISNYDNQGRRTTTIYTLYSDVGVFSKTYTRTYNTDGTLQKVTYPLSFVDNTPVTETIYMGKRKNDLEF